MTGVVMNNACLEPKLCGCGCGKTIGPGKSGQAFAINSIEFEEVCFYAYFDNKRKAKETPQLRRIKFYMIRLNGMTLSV